ncbi:hypothetical protein RAZWK3B_05672 [Roseobacter sp. AzwK-3b]|nr:hypothetical protein RAZWK3B_05672 [Roseobacter sp. AzwK-3b]
MTVLERSEQIRNIGMIHRLPGIIRHQVLLRDIGHVIALLVLGQQMVERLLARRTAVLGDGVIPFLGIREFGIDIKNHPAERVFLVPDHLAQRIFSACFHHHIVAPTRQD